MWARPIGPTGLIPADHGDKRGRYVLIWLFLYCLALCSPPGSVHRAYRDIPHKWARSIGPTGLIPADHGDKRGRYVLILLFLYCWALERLRAGSGPRAGRSKARGQNPGNEDRKISPGKSAIFILEKCFLGLWASLPFFQTPNEASNGPRGCGLGP